MSINWKVRFKNRVWVTTFVTFVISTAYQLLEIFNIAPAISKDTVVQVAMTVVQVLCLLGVVIDPTTKGVSDSERALGYEEPN